jgi:Tol biopolymer transport system component
MGVCSAAAALAVLAAVIALPSPGPAAALQGRCGKLRVVTVRAPQRLRTLTPAGSCDLLAARSPDGRSIAVWRSVGGKTPVIAVTRTDGSGARKLADDPVYLPLDTGGPLVWRPWSPTSRSLAFVLADTSSCGPGETKCATFVPWRADLPSGTLTKLAGPGRVGADGRGALDPSWAPSGGRIAVAAGVDIDGDGHRIDVANADGSAPSTLTAGEALTYNHPAWSPDGRWVAFARSGALVRIAPTGGREQRLATGDFPLWSPDSRRLAYVRFAGGRKTLYTVAASGRGVRRLTGSSRDVTSFAWAPKGGSLALLSSVLTAGRFDGVALETLSADGRRRSLVVRRKGASGFPASVFWSRDGRRLFLVSD